MKNMKKAQTASQRLDQILDLIFRRYDITAFIGDDVYLFYMDDGNANVTVADGTFYHFETFDELVDAPVFEEGKTLKDVCFEIEFENE